MTLHMLGNDASGSFQEVACHIVRKKEIGARQEWWRAKLDNHN